jgi:lysophospholipase L1-like esterase
LASPATALAAGVAPLPPGTTVLAIGDSMADALGTGLRGELPALGIRAVVHAKESTYIPDWAGATLNVRGLVRRTQPDLVVIGLGGNETALADASLRARDIARIVEQLEGRPCVWVTPPVAEPRNGIFEVIRANSKPCRFFDTNEHAPPLERTGDHIHPTYPARRAWAKSLLDWIAREREPNASRPFELKPRAADDTRTSAAPLVPAASTD